MSPQEKYKDWATKTGIEPMTRNQSDFAKWCFENESMISTMGNMESVFQSVRKYIRNQ